MCFAAEQPDRGTIKGYDDQLLAVEVANGDIELLHSSIEILTRLRIIESDEGDLCFINFAKRQYDKPSDRPEQVRERVKKHRQNKCNADVTPSNALDTETDTETEKDTDLSLTPLPPLGESLAGTPVGIFPGSIEGEGAQPTKAGKGAEEYTFEFEAFWEAYPRRKEKQAAFRCWKTRLREGTQPQVLIDAARQYANECIRKSTQEEFIKLAKTFLGPSRPFLDYSEPIRKVVNMDEGRIRPYRG